jgi:predicted regulator of Ras-like GTPase activity (Roadblock/LC7/MglB family)
MSSLETALQALRAHPGVEEVLVLGHDGLLIQHVGDGHIDAETVSAMVPGLRQSAAELGRAAGKGAAATAVVRLERGVAVVEELSADLLLAVLVAGDVPFAGLLREVHARRDALAALV